MESCCRLYVKLINKESHKSLLSRSHFRGSCERGSNILGCDGRLRMWRYMVNLQELPEFRESGPLGVGSETHARAILKLYFSWPRRS